MKPHELIGHPKHLLVECFNNERQQKVTVSLTASTEEEFKYKLDRKLSQRSYDYFRNETEGAFQTRILARV